jgi:hypothetical protein
MRTLALSLFVLCASTLTASAQQPDVYNNNGAYENLPPTANPYRPQPQAQPQQLQPQAQPDAQDAYDSDPDIDGYDAQYDVTYDDAAAQGYDDGYDPNAYQQFQQPLAPYGNWIDDASYGRVWVPSVSVVGYDFAPYSAGGHWVLSDYGWTWVSDWDWGWGPFHYGRWITCGGYGWCWVPGTMWGPAWVSWRSGGGYVGWAPLPPAGVRIGPPHGVRTPWRFTLAAQLGSRSPSYLPAHVVPSVWARTSVISNAHSVMVNNATVRVNAGPTHLAAQTAMHTPVALASIAPHALPHSAIVPHVGAPVAARPWVQARVSGALQQPITVPRGYSPNTVRTNVPRYVAPHSFQQTPFQQRNAPAIQQPHYAQPARYYAPTTAYRAPYAQPAYHYNAPAYRAPYSQPAYHYNAPAYHAPVYSAPHYSAPTYSAPHYSAPSYSAPHYSAPTYSAPHYSAPSSSFSRPSYSAPHFSGGGGHHR